MSAFLSAAFWPWAILFVAGLFEIGWAIGLKYTDGFSRLIPSLLTAGSMLASLALLGLALKQLPLGTAYAVWTGIGTLGTILFGILVLKEPVDLLRLGSMGLILIGIIGLKLGHA
jgi:quaternary ammonium compound-resistance protein SugE